VEVYAPHPHKLATLPDDELRRRRAPVP
jgi:hypothetical protein